MQKSTQNQLVVDFWYADFSIPDILCLNDNGIYPENYENPELLYKFDAFDDCCAAVFPSDVSPLRNPHTSLTCLIGVGSNKPYTRTHCIFLPMIETWLRDPIDGVELAVDFGCFGCWQRDRAGPVVPGFLLGRKALPG